MKKFIAKVRAEFGENHPLGSEVTLIPAVEYPGYYWILHPITGKKTTDLVGTSLLKDLVEIERAA